MKRLLCWIDENKQWVFSGIGVLLVTTLASLGPSIWTDIVGDPAQRLLGTWQVNTPDGIETLQFFPGGTARTSVHGHDDAWSYTIVDDSHLRMENGGIVREAKVVGFDIAGDTLTLQSQGRIIGRYHRAE